MNFSFAMFIFSMKYIQMSTTSQVLVQYFLKQPLEILSILNFKFSLWKMCTKHYVVLFWLSFCLSSVTSCKAFVFCASRSKYSTSGLGGLGGGLSSFLVWSNSRYSILASATSSRAGGGMLASAMASNVGGSLGAREPWFCSAAACTFCDR